ncbi:polysaccharide pyruvyl transferase family protein [Metabacillus litoralis]|uniref:polysaccharide pyruvyl transferase family protein n=1 Tax=Metabacillus litoralis TaxID=152268 RepID=UPI0020403E7F|nr:polysaccharide pyruvyl transferase family protein [Metabacillus litoralis]MCM3161733.1 polysaccharide pyruvyl transferase family protein [Metabacillus litoralis]
MKNDLNQDNMIYIKDQLKIILTVIPKNSNVIYIEYPLHSNIGDMLIMKGTEKFFLDNNICVKKRYSIFDFKTDKKVNNEDILVLHGGGNFGDLYPAHQKFREKVIKTFPNNRIVILPQSIHYNNDINLHKTASIFSSHNDLHVFLRDNISLGIARQYFKCNSYMAPDMAHQLYPITDSKIGNGLLGIIRTDGELNNEYDIDYNKYNNITDWPQLLNRLNYMTIRIFRNLSKLRFINVYPIWTIYKDLLIKKAIKLYNLYDEVETSRLHGFILACLMDKKACLLDNSYGKNSRYFEAHFRFEDKNRRSL